MKNKAIVQNEVGDAPPRRRPHLPIIAYDLILLFAVDLFMLGISPSSAVPFGAIPFIIHFLLSAFCVCGCRYLLGVYRQIWRYGSPAAYIYLIAADAVAGMLYYLLESVLPIAKITFVRAFSIVSFNLLLALTVRLLYKFLYETVNAGGGQKGASLLRALLQLITGLDFAPGESADSTKNTVSPTKIRIAIVGAGQVGVMLAEELLKNPRTIYQPCCFIDIDHSKIGREILGLPVLAGDASVEEHIRRFAVQEIVFALPRMESEYLRELYEHYSRAGCNIKVYDYPMMQTADKGKRQMREFDVEELLFRKSVYCCDAKTSAYYRDKVVLITGGGGSIGGELCRQIASMKPKKLIILDVYENGAYDINQELQIIHGGALDVSIEIVSICDRRGLEAVFAAHRPQVVLHAAAHKHVPLMEHNCCEAVKNNVFGTLNVVELAEQYGVEKFIMISTDKAVNPTNVMGATKRVCEMIVQSHSQMRSATSFSATRFGNVLGSAASVVPLFKKQIANGGPVTVTDKRIIRYFMTIPEASQLVLQSGAMAQNGELYVLDMGKSVRILELAETMIRLSGYEPYRDIDIVETGLRPGEKLYEELLIHSDSLEKTENSMIFIERDECLTREALEEKLQILREAMAGENDGEMKKALMEVVPTYGTPEDVNASAHAMQEIALRSFSPVR